MAEEQAEEHSSFTSEQAEEHSIDTAMTAEQKGIQPSKIAPWYLHSNSTSHTWVFSAIAELIDNACDANASELKIDKRAIRTKDCLSEPKMCLTMLDNGKGMTYEELCNMLSFGFSKHNGKIGKFGNGFKAGSMRLGLDAMVFTCCKTSTSVGFLSQTYLEAIKAKHVIVPMVTWTLRDKNLDREMSIESDANLTAIMTYGLFTSEEQLMTELKSLEKMKNGTGTNIIIFNLVRDKSGKLELDFSSDPLDIRNPETPLNDRTTIDRPVLEVCPKYRKSLREYCSILYFKPRMKIVIRGRKVRTNLINKSLSKTEQDVYKPIWLDRPVRITFGFTKKQDADAYGLMLYYNNRLIKAYHKVGCQKQGKGHGVGVLGVAEVNFLDPTQNKQEFNNTEKYRTFMNAAAGKLNDYYYQKTNTHDPNITDVESENTNYTWAQCDNCNKWRRLPAGNTEDSLPEKWFCRQNPDVFYNRCDITEELEDEDEVPRTTYKKTYKKSMEEKRRKAKSEQATITVSKKIEPIKLDSIDQHRTDPNENTGMNVVEATETIEALTTPVVASTSTPRSGKRKILPDSSSQRVKQSKIDTKEILTTIIYQEACKPFEQMNRDGDTNSGKADTSDTKWVVGDICMQTNQKEIRKDFVTMCVPAIPTAAQSTCQEETNIIQPRPVEQKPVLFEKTRELEDTKQELVGNTKELEHTKQELVGKTKELEHRKQELVGKTKELEDTKQEPVGKTKELECTNQELLKKTKELEGINEQLVGKAKELEDKIQTLLEKTKEIEGTNQKLVLKTKELEGTNQVMREKTKELQRSMLALLEKTKELEGKNQLLLETTKELEGTKQVMLEKTKELERTEHVLFERTNELKWTNQALTAQTEELEGKNQGLFEKTKDLVGTKQELLQKVEELHMTKQNLTSFRTNVCELMKIIISDFDYGEPENIEQVIVEFIQHQKGHR